MDNNTPTSAKSAKIAIIIIVGTTIAMIFVDDSELLLPVETRIDGINEIL